MQPFTLPIPTRRHMLFACSALAVTFGVAGCTDNMQTNSTSTASTTTASASDQMRLIDDARATLNSFTSDPQNRSIRDMLSP